MTKTMGNFLGWCFLSFVLAAIFGPTFYGLYLAFKASFILGIAVLILEPSPWVIGVYALFGNPDICIRIAKWFGLDV